MPDIHEVFTQLRKEARKKCTCGNRDLIAALFHEPYCEYYGIAMAAIFSPGDESVPTVRTEIKSA